MIHYDSGRYGVGAICHLRGSVIPRALIWSVGNAIVVALFRIAIMGHADIPDSIVTTKDGITIGLTGYTMVLGFLLVFRTREAYGRYWESLTLLQTTRGEWFGAYSNLLAFCTHDPGKQMAVEKFQHLLVRLMSLLYACAMEYVSTVEGISFDIIDLCGVDADHLEFLSQQDDKIDIVLQWLSQLIVTKHKEGIVDIAPPIFSRVFQELSRGKVNITNARKIREFPFPFPYAQLLEMSLLVHWIFNPILLSIVCKNPVWAGILAFSTTLFIWGVFYVGVEIEEPYGDDDNDLPLEAIQRSFNCSLVSLLRWQAQSSPKFIFDDQDRSLNMVSYLEAFNPQASRSISSAGHASHDHLQDPTSVNMGYTFSFMSLFARHSSNATVSSQNPSQHTSHASSSHTITSRSSGEKPFSSYQSYQSKRAPINQRKRPKGYGRYLRSSAMNLGNIDLAAGFTQLASSDSVDLTFVVASASADVGDMQVPFPRTSAGRLSGGRLETIPDNSDKVHPIASEPFPRTSAGQLSRATS